MTAPRWKPVTLADLRREAPKGWVTNESSDMGDVSVWVYGPEYHKLRCSEWRFTVRSMNRQTARRAALAALKELSRG